MLVSQLYLTLLDGPDWKESERVDVGPAESWLRTANRTPESALEL